ncbi:transcriptional regulator [Pseudomonas sp. ICMP 8385]|uniref:LexA family transcriptional regulator n=1 Tax=Pseudomonas sp. ICMP 8385 TaxID=1718920 RepID=UPI000C082C0E|nr:S24 family peptidase [Pseudomonas sp. ICMP 8385]PHN66469.1 transcriptional regulator [Pseudomonas sp. ICMP 8385]
MKKRELTSVEKEECQALKAIYLAKKKQLGLSQEKMAEDFGMTQTGVSMYLNGKNSLNVMTAAKFSKLLQVPISSFSPRIAATVERLAKINVATEAVPVESNAEHLGDLSVWEDGDRLDEDDCEVPYYAEVEFAGGTGMTEVIELTDRKLRFSQATLRAAGVDCRSAACARVKGKSMERLILDGAAIGFDRSCTAIFDGEIYAFNQEGMLRVKYLYRMPGGGVRIRSENSDEYPDEIMNAETFNEQVQMLGRVFWWSTVRRAPRF